MATRQLVGVGVGPGDPELVTVKAVRVLWAADVVLVPVLSDDEPGRAETTVLAHVEHDRVRRVVFALNERTDAARREAAWDAAADTVVDAFREDVTTVAFATIGDPNVYSTFTYLAQTVRERLPEVATPTIPGITAMQDLAARSGTVLSEGSETLALFPMTAGADRFQAALSAFDTVVAYKGGRQLPRMLATVDRAGRLDTAVYGASLGLADEDIRPAADVTGSAPYLSTVLIPGRRSSRGGKI